MEVALVYVFVSSDLFIDIAYQLKFILLPKMVLKSRSIHRNPLLKEASEPIKRWRVMDVIRFMMFIGKGGKLGSISVFLFMQFHRKSSVQAHKACHM